MKHILLLIALITAPCTQCLASSSREAATNTILATIEANNLELQLARAQGARAVLELKAQNGLGETEVEYSPFFARGVNGLSSSELIVSQSFELPWAYASRSRMSRAQGVANDALYAALRQDVLLRARNLCIEMDGLRQALAVIDRRMHIADSLQMLCERMVQSGDATALDLNTIRIERMGVSREQIETRTAMSKAHAALVALNGGQPISTESIAPPDNAGHATVPCDYQLSSVNCQLSDLRLVAADAVIASARQRERVAASESLPRLTLGYRRNADTEVAQHGMLIGATIPLFSNQKRRTIARHEREEAELQRRQTETEIEQERMALQAELQQAADILATSDPAIIDETLTLLYRSLAEGQISLPEYLQQTAPLYERLQSIIATRTLYLQTLSSLNRGDCSLSFGS